MQLSKHCIEMDRIQWWKDIVDVHEFPQHWEIYKILYPGKTQLISNDNTTNIDQMYTVGIVSKMMTCLTGNGWFVNDDWKLLICVLYRDDCPKRVSLIIQCWKDIKHTAGDRSLWYYLLESLVRLFILSGLCLQLKMIISRAHKVDNSKVISHFLFP